MRTKTLDEIRTLRNSANQLKGFWPTWRTKYLSDSHCDKKGASFTSQDERFSGFKFTLMFENHAGYYGNSSCHTVFRLDDKLAARYFRQAIQEMAEPLFERVADLMLADAASLTQDAAAEIAALQSLLDEVTAQAGVTPTGAETTGSVGEADSTRSSQEDAPDPLSQSPTERTDNDR